VKRLVGITNFKDEIAQLWRSAFVYIVLVALIIIFSLINEKFFSLENFFVIGRQTAITAVVAFGMTFVITTAQIDLSVGSIVGVVVMVATLTLEAGFGPVIATLAGLLVGSFFGLANGVITTKLHIPSFLVTLGTLGIARGVAMTVTNNQTVVVYDQNFTRFWGAGDIFGVPISILWTLLFFVIALVLYNFTPFGNYVRATGGNVVAAEFSGINTDRIVIKAFLISGFLSAISGLMMVSRINAGRPEVGADLALDSITAVILGGTSLFGGKGSIVKTLVGALMITMITNALIIFGFQINVQMIVKGLIVIAAVSISEKQT
jgi:ribose transport system permease protein